MSEHSRFWDSTSPGDASDAPYDFGTELSEVLSALTGAEGIAGHGGVFRDALNKLACTTAGTVQVTVATGLGLSYGGWYYNDAPLNIAIPTPATSTRIDRIVLRKSWASQTVRLTRIAGVEGSGSASALGIGTPAYTQTAGTTWDVPLFQVTINTSGTITNPVTDERVYLPVHGNQASEGGTKHAYSQVSGTPALYAGTPVAVTPGVGGSAGVSVDISHGDHVHALAAPLLAVTGSNQTFPTTTLSNVTDLVLAVVANTKYLVEGIVYTFDSIGPNAGIKLAFTVPAGAVLLFDSIGVDPTDPVTIKTLVSGMTNGAHNFGTSIVVQAVHIRGTLTVAGTAGNLQMQAAAINAGTLQIQAMSHLYALAQ